MGLKDDFEGLKRGWSEFGLLAKLFLGSSLLVSALSIGSLAETVFKFKGFIVTAIEFYRDVVGPVFSWLLGWLSIEVAQYQADVLLVFAVLVISTVRAAFHYPRRYPNERFAVAFAGLFILGTLFLPGMVVKNVLFSHNFDPSNPDRGVIKFSILDSEVHLADDEIGLTVLCMFILLYLVPGVLGVIANWLDKLSGEPPSDSDWTICFPGLYLTAASLLIALVAAISEGLTRVS